MAKKNEGIPSVLAFEKKLVTSDGFMYGTSWEKRLEKSSSTPLKLIEKSVLGTISNRLKPALQNDPLKLNAEVEKPNLQTVDSCALPEYLDTLKLTFTLKVLGGIEKPSASNGDEFNKTFPSIVREYTEKSGFAELANRYALNIANARYLWRNRVGAEKVEVHVRADGKQWKFNAQEFSLRDFHHTNSEVQGLATLIASALSGKMPFLLLEIEAFALIGKAQEVYPSEELVLDKGKSQKSKILYQVNDTAAMHSQKIGNAIRTIDTWYPSYSENGNLPIAIEPYGAVTNLGKAFRGPKDKADFYSLFDRFALGEPLASQDEEHYVMAVLVRGGVFGKSSDKEKD